MLRRGAAVVDFSDVDWKVEEATDCESPIDWVGDDVVEECRALLAVEVSESAVTVAGLLAVVVAGLRPVDVVVCVFSTPLGLVLDLDGDASTTSQSGMNVSVESTRIGAGSTLLRARQPNQLAVSSYLRSGKWSSRITSSRQYGALWSRIVHVFLNVT